MSLQNVEIVRRHLDAPRIGAGEGRAVSLRHQSARAEQSGALMSEGGATVFAVTAASGACP
jgi:hypothetical protein